MGQLRLSRPLKPPPDKPRPQARITLEDLAIWDVWWGSRQGSQAHTVRHGALETKLGRSPEQPDRLVRLYGLTEQGMADLANRESSRGICQLPSEILGGHLWDSGMNWQCHWDQHETQPTSGMRPGISLDTASEK